MHASRIIHIVGGLFDLPIARRSGDLRISITGYWRYWRYCTTHWSIFISSTSCLLSFVPLFFLRFPCFVVPLSTRRSPLNFFIFFSGDASFSFFMLPATPPPYWPGLPYMAAGSVSALIAQVMQSGHINQQPPAKVQNSSNSLTALTLTTVEWDVHSNCL